MTLFYILLVLFIIYLSIPKFWIPGYLTRWHLFPRNKSPWLPNIYLHRFTGDDREGVMHNHPWDSWSICLKGVLWEEYCSPASEAFFHISGEDGGTINATMLCSRGISKESGIIKREHSTYHRIAVLEGPAWTLFITGPTKTIKGSWFFIKDYKDFSIVSSGNLFLPLRTMARNRILWSYYIDTERKPIRLSYKTARDFLSGIFNKILKKST